MVHDTRQEAAGINTISPAESVPASTLPTLSPPLSPIERDWRRNRLNDPQEVCLPVRKGD